ncbi:flavin-containing monooxygenase [Halopseudomonas pelagia]|uniref:FAD-dependent oxidoreductase n=1 Tax=Halopseudomonas pelagia TaxID=553151 RepID=A0AA91U7F2_9GAMM|nr:NAD(P)-binding domain-containing protein [Halopseudomonas pelagia]PCD01429.1 monooxygenase [Halopseudomonas pelagia]QFY55008.1 FAD-dependent oxidoreductase [Halopseudomonas pelagia]
MKQQKTFDETRRVCVIGAGPSGIAAAKNCVQSGLDVVVFEKNDKVGGNWVFNSKTGHSSVYENTHIISSKAWSEYEDFPMPDDYPEYPNHRQLQAYFESYAKHFGAYDQIRFNHTVQRVSRTPAGLWQVCYLDNQNVEHTEIFDVMMVSNGHHWDPKNPSYPGEFSGKFMHSHDFKGVTEEWRGKNVLVIGAGNSACDVAVESARIASKVCLSMRSPQWFLPKFLFGGVPTDAYMARDPWVPTAVGQYMVSNLLRMLQGSYKKMGLPEPKRPVMSHHPTLNSDLLDFIRHGRVKPRPGIKALHGEEVEFTDGSREAFDLICACTGYWTTFPFFDTDFINFKHLEKVPLYHKMMHADYQNLYFIGLFQPTGCIWPMADRQAKLACAEILGLYQRPSDMKAAIQHQLDNPHVEFEGGQRHAVQVEYHQFRQDLRNELRTAGIDIGEAPKKDIYPVQEGEPDLKTANARAMHGIEIKIVDTNGQTLPNDGVTEGELLVCGPTCGDGSLDNPVPVEQNEWLPSGYVARIDAKGTLMLGDRIESAQPAQTASADLAEATP